MNTMNWNQTIAIAVIIIVLTGIAYVLGMAATNRSGTGACTAEAKLCPDGSYVERVGPSCEFAPCPLLQGGVEVTY